MNKVATWLLIVVVLLLAAYSLSMGSAGGGDLGHDDPCLTMRCDP